VSLASLAPAPEGVRMPPIGWRLDLLATRAQLCLEGALSVAYAREHAIDWQAVALEAGIMVLARVRFEPGRTFELGGRVPAAVIEAYGEDAAEPLDLVAWPLNRPDKFARLYGRVAVLGARAIADASVDTRDRPLPVHRTPLAWLQARCDGAVLLDLHSGIRVLRDVPGGIAAEDEAHAADLASLMVASLPLARIKVPRRPAAR